MKKWFEPKTVKLCLGVIAGSVLAYAQGDVAGHQVTGMETIIAILFGLFGIFSRLGVIKVENNMAQMQTDQGLGQKEISSEITGPQ